MKSRENFKISLEEFASRGQVIVAQQSEISFSKALEQLRRLKANSNVEHSSKKSRKSGNKPENAVFSGS
jgi:hypothetical protein